LKFSEFGFDPRLLESIDSLGYNEATPIQQQAIPFIMQGHDLLGSAQTGTGKTAAFLLPVINNIITSSSSEGIKAMVIVPTRELAVQIDQQMEGFSYFTPVSSMAIYGGTDGITFEREKQALTEGADVVICTPGRIIAHFNQGYVNVSELKYLILDEADRMLDMGFYDDIMKIVSFLPENRQNIMFAATMPKDIGVLARKTLVNPKEVNISISKPAEKILQVAYCVYDSQKIPLTVHTLSSKNIKSVLIFCSTKSSTKQLSRELKHAGVKVAEIHSDLDQKTREEVMLDFRNHKTTVLVATDIVSRGIDVEDIDLIINYDVPNDGEDYIHRIGRTARAESDGVAITFINQKEQQKFADIEKLLGEAVPKAIIPSQFGDAPEYNPSKYSRSSGRNFSGRRDQKKKKY
jgi:superfamily II DNA/RNA helicase